MAIENLDSGPEPMATTASVGERVLPRALRNGARQRCPACGVGRLYGKFLKIKESCDSCGEVLHHQRADDAPAYFTIVVVAHVIVGGILATERAFQPETWLQLAIWLPLTAILSLLLLPRIKGMLVALQWALRMHGFGGQPDQPEPVPAADIQTRSNTRNVRP